MKPKIFTLAATGETLCTKRCSCYNEKNFLSLVKILREADIEYISKCSSPWGTEIDYKNGIGIVKL